MLETRYILLCISYFTKYEIQKSPLQMAASAGNVELVEFLQRHGARDDPSSVCIFYSLNFRLIYARTEMDSFIMRAGAIL